MDYPCFLLFAACCNDVLLAFLTYACFAFLLRVFLGEAVWLQTQFWFYLSTTAFTIVFIPVFHQLPSLCQFSCFGYLPIHCWMRVSIIAFVYYKLDVFNPDRFSINTRGKSWGNATEKACFLLIALYIFIMIIRSITRFWSRCYDVDESAGCIAEADPILYLYNVPDLMLAFCECVLCYRLVTGSKLLQVELLESGELTSFQEEILNRMWWYRFTSLTSLTTNLIQYVGLLIIGILGYFASAHTNTYGEDAFWLWSIFLSLSIWNIIINVTMVTICFPLRSLNVPVLIASIWKCQGFEDMTFQQVDFTPEQIQEFMEAETDRRSLRGGNPRDPLPQRSAEWREWSDHVREGSQPGQNIISRNCVPDIDSNLRADMVIALSTTDNSQCTDGDEENSVVEIPPHIPQMQVALE